MMPFDIQGLDPHSQARAGLLTTAHGKIHTPIFMPVGTLGTVKGIQQRELVQDIDAEIILANTYHLYLRPGMEVMQQAGGLHHFMGWQRSILTDSGGYQVYSLHGNCQLSEDGVAFRSHIDGSSHFFSPEKAIAIQRTIGADIIMAFDECTPEGCSYEYARTSMERTHRWLQRCQIAFQESANKHNAYQALFPIIQGSIFKDLRQEAIATVVATEAPGYAIGGVCHPTGHLYEVAGYVCEGLPVEKPRYLMGVGTPKDLLACIALGVDMFDCVMPARNGRNGMLFTTQGIVHIKNSKWRKAFSPIDDGLKGYASLTHTRAYLHHLFKSKERLGAQIATLHNLSFYLWLVREARKHIVTGDFKVWKDKMVPVFMQKI